MKYKSKILFYLKYITDEKVLETLKYITDEKVLETIYRIVRAEFDKEEF